MADPRDTIPRVHDGPVVHVAFGHSAAKSLRDALKSLGRDERVAMYPDDLGYGPINPSSVEARAEFWGEVMLFEDNPTIGEQTNAFWADVATDSANQVAWLSRLSVREYAAFHEYVSRRDSAPLPSWTLRTFCSRVRRSRPSASRSSVQMRSYEWTSCRA